MSLIKKFLNFLLLLGLLVPVSALSSDKSTLNAGLIGGIGGFGLGHYYAKDAWTVRSTTWAIVDFVYIVASLGILTQQDGGFTHSKFSIFGGGLVAIRTWEGFDAAGEVSGSDLSLSQGKNSSLSFSETKLDVSVLKISF